MGDPRRTAARHHDPYAPGVAYRVERSAPVAVPRASGQRSDEGGNWGRLCGIESLQGGAEAQTCAHRREDSAADTRATRPAHQPQAPHEARTSASRWLTIHVVGRDRAADVSRSSSALSSALSPTSKPARWRARTELTATRSARGSSLTATAISKARRYPASPRSVRPKSRATSARGMSRCLGG
jgi:hypothetical protein